MLEARPGRRVHSRPLWAPPGSSSSPAPARGPAAATNRRAATRRHGQQGSGTGRPWRRPAGGRRRRTTRWSCTTSPRTPRNAGTSPLRGRPSPTPSAAASLPRGSPARATSAAEGSISKVDVTMMRRFDFHGRTVLLDPPTTASDFRRHRGSHVRFFCLPRLWLRMSPWHRTLVEGVESFLPGDRLPPGEIA